MNAYIAPFGTDLIFDPSIIPPAEAFYWNSPYNDSLVVSWIRVPFWANTAQGYTGENTFQLILEKNTNRITFQYQTQTGVPSMIPNFTTVGIESPSGLSGLNPLYDVLPTPVTAIRFDVGEYNKVKGRAFVDLNSNNVQDGAEPNLEGKLLTNVQNATYALTGINGDYTFSVSDTSAFDIYPPTIKHYSAVPANHTGFMTGPNHVDSLNDFIYQPDSIFDDLEVRLNQTGPFRPGFNAGYVISYANKGTTFLTPQLMLHKSPALSFISSTVTPSLLSPDSLVFNLPQLPPLQSGMIQVMFKLDSTTSIGTVLMVAVQMTPVVNDAYPLNNTDTLFSTVGGSFDPNDITVDRVSISIDSILNPIDLTYLIRFQNTGTDTAFNIYVVNDLPLELDLSTFEMLGASHPNQINLDANTRRLVFNFPLILLPDSNVNEPASHGFILYRVRPQTTLQLGDTIPNSAAIYFDFNLPVLTNTALTIIQSPTIGLNPLNDNSIKLLLFPNPVADQLNISGIKLENGKAQLRLTDIYGKLILEKIITTTNTTLETTPLSHGIYLIQSGELRATFVKQ
ncbi:MAG: T9SS type A sorting domain-containing protein [Bacteroidetes bacterium]|nr:T9SS type A sorting domain-containing protein [Bacteroidota bacterium]